MKARFNQSAHDREYSPSSCVDDIDVYLDEYAARSQKVKITALAEGSCVADLAYGNSPDERLDLFLPATMGPAPLHVFIHGGFWQALSKEDALFAAPMFQSHGSFFAALNYSLAPQASLTEIVNQIRRAVMWLFHNAGRWGFDPASIYVSGSSAGAHLAAILLQTNWTEFGLDKNIIKGLCAVSGIYDLAPIRYSYVNEVLGLSQREVLDYSPMNQPIHNSCPVILAYGDNETSEFKRQTNEYRKHLSLSTEEVRFNEIMGRNHFDVIMDLMDQNSWLSQQVLRQMKLKLHEN